jgi:hypothetical protein
MEILGKSGQLYGNVTFQVRCELMEKGKGGCGGGSELSESTNKENQSIS